MYFFFFFFFFPRVRPGQDFPSQHVFVGLNLFLYSGQQTYSEGIMVVADVGDGLTVSRVSAFWTGRLYLYFLSPLLSSELMNGGRLCCGLPHFLSMPLGML